MKDLGGCCNWTPSSTWKRKLTPSQQYCLTFYGLSGDSGCCHRASGASGIMETFHISFLNCAKVFCQLIIYFKYFYNISRHHDLNCSICFCKLQRWFRHDDLAQSCCLYPSRMQSVLPLLFCMCQTFLVALSPLNRPLLKTDQGFTCLTWLELLTFFPHSEDRSCRLLLDRNL